jgi:ADP-ribose pyrophosphatase YjhB (NUDIX family)
VGVGAVIFVEGRVVLVKRGHPPLEGQWTLPGGTVEIGEGLRATLVREMQEETGLDVEVGPVLEVFDRIERDEEGRVRYHHVIVDYLCRARGGDLRAADDALEVALADPADLDGWRLTPKAHEVIEKALRASRDELRATSRKRANGRASKF